jgi:hypothetical protein
MLGDAVLINAIGLDEVFGRVSRSAISAHVAAPEHDVAERKDPGPAGLA